MSIAEFYAVAAGLITLLVIIIAVPLHRAKSQKAADEVTNVGLVKARLAEMQREVSEGVLSDADYLQAAEEVKLALVEEQQAVKKNKRPVMVPVFVGAVLALIAGLWVYKDVNHLDGVEAIALAPENLQTLSAKLVDPSQAEDISPQDIQALALGIRLRLKNEPDDAQGWMFLGRLRMSLGQLEESVAAFERSLELRPDNTMTKVSFAQALMMTGSEEGLRRSQRVLQNLLADNPGNDNLVLMMAVTSAQLGQNDVAMNYYKIVRNKLEPNNPMRVTLDRQLGLTSTDDISAANALQISIELSPELKANREQLSKMQSLVVFVRPADQSSGVPVAVKRMALPDFPVTLTLTDDDAMMPTSVLSDYSNVTVTARVSASSDVSAKSGDWQGESVINARVAAETYPITINKEIE